MSIGDWCDVAWTLICEEGKGGFMDSAKYREVMTDLFFYGKEYVPTAKERKEAQERAVRDAKAARGTAPPPDALAQMRELSEQLAAARKARRVASSASE